MADLTITAANVVAGTGAVKETGIAGATITAGQVVYRDPSDSKFKLADADNAAVAVRSPIGIALAGAAASQPLTIVTSGPVTIGATMTAGLVYYLSPNPGGIAPVADVLAGDDVVVVGVATSTTVLRVGIVISGVTL